MKHQNKASCAAPVFNSVRVHMRCFPEYRGPGEETEQKVIKLHEKCSAPSSTEIRIASSLNFLLISMGCSPYGRPI